MPSDDRIDDTVPSRHADRGSGRRPRAPSTLAQIPARVWVFAVFAAILLFALCGFWGLYLFRGRFAAQNPTPTAIIWTPIPSPSPAATPSLTPTEPPSSEGPADATPTASPDIAIGNYIEIAGTGGYGLSLRSGPGLNYARMDVASEGETFIVVEGPTTAGGSPWWKVRDPESEERAYWAIGNYLKPIEHP
ncbi:MAG: SH3 domain-containing protein [Anaerolineae bacterium]